MVPLSVLDLAPIVEDGNAAQALHRSLDLAQHAERWGYRRFWLAEHHGMPGIASAATAVVIGHVAAGTSTIRVGAGGIMLPNHAPLLIAEQFGTLASLYPGRIDLGARPRPRVRPAHHPRTAPEPACRRDLPRGRCRADGLFPAAASRPTRAGGARGRARRADLDPGLEPVRRRARRRRSACRTPSPRTSRRPRCSRPSSCTAPASSRRTGSTGRTSCSASTSSRRRRTTKARRLFTSLQQAFVNLRRGHPGRLPPPDERLPRAAAARRPASPRPDAVLLRSRLARDGAARSGGDRRPHRRGRAHAHLADLRSRRAAALLRAGGGAIPVGASDGFDRGSRHGARWRFCPRTVP